MFSFGTRTSFSSNVAVAGALDAELLHAPVDHVESRHVLRDEERRDRGLAGLVRDGRARHHRHHIRDVDVGDVTLPAIENVGAAVFRRRRGHLDGGGIRAGVFFGQRKRRQLLTRDERRQPARLLLLCAEQQQRAHADRVVRVCEDGNRRVPLADLLQHLAVLHLRKSAAAVLLRRRHAENAGAREAVDHVPRDVGVAVDPVGIELLVEHRPDLGQRRVEILLLRGRDARIRHRPIGDKLAEEETFRETELLVAAEEQLLGLLHFLLPLNFDFVHNRIPWVICVGGSHREPRRLASAEKPRG
jgi:hypothetical protein